MNIQGWEFHICDHCGPLAELTKIIMCCGTYYLLFVCKLIQNWWMDLDYILSVNTNIIWKWDEVH